MTARAHRKGQKPDPLELACIRLAAAYALHKARKMHRPTRKADRWLIRAHAALCAAGGPK